MSAFSSILLITQLLAGDAGSAEPRLADRQVAPQAIELAQLSIEQRVIIRIPTMNSGENEAARRAVMQWTASKGPRCVPLNLVRAATVTGESGVTMLVSRAERYLAHVGRTCRAADFYAGFYISPNKDGAICARRDTLHARNGSACEIEKFSRLTLERVDD